MAIECTATALADASACYCFQHDKAEQVKIYLLAVIAGLGGLTPSELATRAKCYCFDAKTAKEVIPYLLCQIANSLPAS